MSVTNVRWLPPTPAAGVTAIGRRLAFRLAGEWHLAGGATSVWRYAEPRVDVR